VINLAIAQRLLRRLCEHCKKPVKPDPHIADIIMAELSTIPESVLKEYDVPAEMNIYKAEGCKYCANKGTQGRIAIYEILAMSPELEKIILEGVSEAKIGAEAKRQGMITMKQDGIIKVLKGMLSFEEVIGSVEK
jgi:type IV pilus assembly protein PilB